MLLAIILADLNKPVQGMPPYLLPLGDESIIERTAAAVLRGPFGGTIVASAPQFAPKIREQLQGFAVQHLQVKGLNKGPHAALIESIAFAETFRERWEKAMAAATSRFTDDEDDEEDDEEEEEARPPQPVKKSAARPKSQKGATKAPRDWSSHRKSADVKIRGLARSFDRNGVILFRGERPAVRPELQAQIVEAFGREAADKAAAARGFSQAVFEGQRGYPIAMTFEAAREVAALPVATIFDDWLLDNLNRVQDVKVDDPGAVEGVYSDAEYTALLARLKL